MNASDASASHRHRSEVDGTNQTDATGIPRVPLRGTAPQIRSALRFYTVMAYATGVMLLLLALEMILRYGFGLMLAAGGIDPTSGANHVLGFVEVDSTGSLPLLGAFNISLAVLIIHGWMYVVYLVADFRLWSLMRWPFTLFLLIALGGVVPLLSFIVERRITRRALDELTRHPQLTPRY